MDFSSVFRQVKRARSDDRVDEEEKATRTFAPDRWQFLSGNTVRAYPPGGNTDNARFLPEDTGTLRPTAMTAVARVSPWRLPSQQSIAESQQYLNDQLQHVVALSSVLLSDSEKTTRNKFLLQERAEQDDVDRVCSLDVTSLWTLLAVGSEAQTLQQQTAERGLRDVLDLVSFLLYVRERELAHQNRLSESLSRAEKQLERKGHIVQTLASDLETFKQNSAQRENVLKAREQVLLTERKTLQMEKKSAEVHCARLQGVETAYKAQLRKKDVDYARLKKSLQDVVARAAKEKRGMAIAKPLNGVQERKQISMTNQSKESKLTKQIMENLERKKAELLCDNEALAKRYDTLQHHLQALTSQYKKAVQLFLAQKSLGGNSEEFEKLAGAPIDDFTPTPFNMATKKGISQYIARSMEALDNRLKQLEEAIRNELPLAEARSDKEALKCLRQKLDDAHGIINEQDQLLQASLIVPIVDVRLGHGTSQQGMGAKASAACAARLRSSPDASAEEDLVREKRELAVLRQNLQNERKLLQEQAIKLDKDRLEFEITRQDQLFGSFSAEKQASPSIVDNADCSTPKRRCRAKVSDVDDMDIPFDVPVSATPETAALLKNIGINVPTEQ
ncbi:unnamed protein product [Hyaloperonospora brassicae]|uniref:Cilium assembly protein DZIP1 N-terminal domain-containing protein n=1 Tax=Hyaloperonospora brassicae TaxID=162125 RepID=A0AAV0UG13_HYABA|nr:unnamed protein product [Hyaloperonospora brassicae]